MKYKQVTKEAFDEYIKAYPHKLEYDVNAIGAPPYGSYYDFSISQNVDEAQVAYIILYDGTKYYDFKNREYYIPDFYAELHINFLDWVIKNFRYDADEEVFYELDTEDGTSEQKDVEQVYTAYLKHTRE